MAAPENDRAATLPSNVGHVFGVSSPVCIDAAAVARRVERFLERPHEPIGTPFNPRAAAPLVEPGDLS